MEYKKYGASGVESYDAKARRSVIEFSLQRCREYAGSFNHHDVDSENDHIWEHQWDQFLTDFYLVCHENSKIQVSTKVGYWYSSYYLIPIHFLYHFKIYL